MAPEVIQLLVLNNDKAALSFPLSISETFFCPDVQEASTMDYTTWSEGNEEELVKRAVTLLRLPQRSVLGIAGAPASGKSTLANALLRQLSTTHPEQVVLVGMDAFHIGHQILERRREVTEKGAPHTFDVRGYLNLLRRLRSESETVYAPEFHREIEDSVAQSVEIPPQVRLVVTEGNYLLLPHYPWNGVRQLLDEAWFVHLDNEERRRRMVSRHQQYGHDLAWATARAYGSDDRNAALVNRTQTDADLWIEQLMA